MGVGQVVDAGEQAAEVHAVADDAADRNPAEADAVIAPLAADQPGLGPLSARPLVGEGDLQRRIDRLRAGVGEEDPVQVERRDRRQPGGEGEGQRMAHVEAGGIVHLAGLPPHRLDDAGAIVPGVDAPEAGGAIEDLPPVGRRVVHPLGAGEHTRVGLEPPVGGEGHPVGVELVGAMGLHRVASVFALAMAGRTRQCDHR